LGEFDFTFQRSVKKTVIKHLGQLDFLHAKENVIMLGPPATGKTHLAIAPGIRACLAGQRAILKTATEWVALIADQQRQGRLGDRQIQQTVRRLRRNLRRRDHRRRNGRPTRAPRRHPLLKGDSYRLEDRELGHLTPAENWGLAD
jgi:hypothetical protein